jgi:hypothetical protein
MGGYFHSNPSGSGANKKEKFCLKCKKPIGTNNSTPKKNSDDYCPGCWEEIVAESIEWIKNEPFG